MYVCKFVYMYINMYAYINININRFVYLYKHKFFKKNKNMSNNQPLQTYIDMHLRTYHSILAGFGPGRAAIQSVVCV